PRSGSRNAMANHGAIDVAMRWQLTVREPFRLVRTVRLHFNRQGHVVGHSVGFHRPILHGPAGLDEIAEASAAKIAAAFIGSHLTSAARPVSPRTWSAAEWGEYETASTKALICGLP